MNILDLERLDKGYFKIFYGLQQVANKMKEIEKQSFEDADAKLRYVNAL